jgi:hypothetical protein
MENIVITRLRELRLYLKNQQYPEEIVEHGIQKALEKGPIHTELREQAHVTSNQNNIIPFVATYNPRDYNIDISCITVKVRPFLNVNEVASIKLGHVIHLLSVHFLTDFHESSPSVKKCTDKRCMTCPSLTIICSNCGEF